jgi:hypothetical protein
MKRLIWLPIAGFLLIAGATVAAAAPSLLGDARGLLVDSQADTDTVTVTGDADHPGRDLLATVLADLVSNGTITQAQSDAITQALQDKVDERIAEMEARRTLIQGFVADGVITQDEINQLPADDPLRVAFDSIADDGQISLDQLRALGPFGGPRGHGGPGGMHGPGGGFMWGDPAASPNP